MRRIRIFFLDFARNRRINRSAKVVGFCILCCLVLFISDVAYGGLCYGRIRAIGGGGTSRGGSFTLMGTIGQPIKGSSSGGQFVLASGFWVSETPPKPATGDLEGLVLDRYEHPVQERYIPTVTAIDSLGQTISDMTDSSGYFLIAGLNTGLATATAQATGYQPATQTVNIVAGTIERILFFLIPVSLPNVQTNGATDVSGDSATLNGNLTSVGSLPPVRVCFGWGTSPGGSYTLVDVGYLSAPGTFSYSISGLNEGTTYYFQAWADGIWGGEKSFETMSRPVEPIPPI